MSDSLRTLLRSYSFLTKQINHQMAGRPAITKQEDQQWLDYDIQLLNRLLEAIVRPDPRMIIEIPPAR